MFRSFLGLVASSLCILEDVFALPSYSVIFLFLSWCFEDSPFVFALGQFNYNVSCHGLPLIYLVNSSLCFLDLDVCFLLQVREILGIVSLNNTTFSLLLEVL